MSYLHSIPFSYRVEADAGHLLPLAEHLRNRLKALPGFKVWQRRHDDHLLLVLANLILVYRIHPETYVAYSRNKNDYSLPTSRTRTFKVAYGATMRIIDGLYDLELLEGTKGIFYDNEDDKENPLLAFRARMRPSGELRAALSSSPVKLRLGEPEKSRELLVLRDLEQNDQPVPDNEETARMRSNLIRINEVNRRHFIALCVLDEEYENICRRMTGNRYGGYATINIFFAETEPIYRVFKPTLNEGGRFYGGSWETMPKECRRFLRIDNISVVELDFSCLHPTLLYLEDGLTPPEGDMYEVPGFPPEARTFLKVSLNIILNAKSRRSAKLAIRNEQREDPDFPPLPEGMTLDQLFDGFLDKHSAIKDHFFTVAGRRLQRIDSDIAESVMLRMAENDIPILPLHDSFLVSRVHREALNAAMDDVVSERYGRMIKIKADDSAWDSIYDIGIEDDYGRDIDRWEREALNHPGFTIYNAQMDRFNARGMQT